MKAPIYLGWQQIYARAKPEFFSDLDDWVARQKVPVTRGKAIVMLACQALQTEAAKARRSADSKAA